MKNILIKVYSTHIRINASTSGELPDGIGWIQKTLDSLKQITFDKKIRRFVVEWRYYAYDYATQEFLLPRHILDNLTSELQRQNITYNIEYMNAIIPNYAYMNMGADWVDRPEHAIALEFLLNEENPMRCCNMQTGLGKTYVAIKTSTLFRYTTLIICEGLEEQWKANVIEKTDVTEDQIYLIKGSKSLITLFDANNTSSEYKIFIASLSTLRNWIVGTDSPYTEIPTYTKFLELYGIGVKIIDEFHLNFSAIVALDLRSNVLHNIYLSATPKRSYGSSRNIFKRIFPNDIIGGASVYNRYVHVSMYAYKLDIPKPRKVMTAHGYNHGKYESVILAHDYLRNAFVYDILNPLIVAHYINTFNRGKLLILCHTVSFCSVIQQHISYIYKDKDVRTYTADDPYENLNADIIISTPKSCGTGKDIKDLLCCINTISLASEPLVEQILGRIRKPSDGTTPEFVDMYNKLLERHVYHKKTRSFIYNMRALRYNEYTI